MFRIEQLSPTKVAPLTRFGSGAALSEKPAVSATSTFGPKANLVGRGGYQASD